MIRYVTQGGVKLKRYILLHRGEGVKNDQNWRYVIFGRPLRYIEIEMYSLQFCTWRILKPKSFIPQVHIEHFRSSGYNNIFVFIVTS